MKPTNHKEHRGGHEQTAGVEIARSDPKIDEGGPHRLPITDEVRFIQGVLAFVRLADHGTIGGIASRSAAGSRCGRPSVPTTA